MMSTSRHHGDVVQELRGQHLQGHALDLLLGDVAALVGVQAVEDLQQGGQGGLKGICTT